MTDQMPFYPATAHALGCGMNNGRPVIACICGLPNKGLSEPGAVTDQMPPKPDARTFASSVFQNRETIRINRNDLIGYLEAHAHDLAARLAASQAMAGELAEALAAIIKHPPCSDPDCCSVAIANAKATDKGKAALTRFQEATR